MRPVILSLLGVLCCGIVLVVVLKPSANQGLATADDTSPIDSLVRDALKQWQVPGLAIAIVRNDEVVYLKGFGVKETGKPDPVTPDTLFPIASCTKGFTTTAMAMLVDEGKMAWDDPVRKHVPYFRLADPLADAEVTLRDLVCHRTGVGANDLLWYRAPLGREEVIRRIGLVKPRHSFRAAFEYQSTMFTTAGVAVESASGMPWEQLVRKRILDPLGMKQVTFTTPAAQASDHASPHKKGAHGKPQVIPWYAIEKPEPAGSINASARDLSRWLRFHLGQGAFEGKRLVSADSLAQTHSPQMIIPLVGTTRAMNPDTFQMSYGMAWVIQDYREQLLVSHAGTIDGFRSHFTMAPRAGIGIVLLNNLERTQMNVALSNTLIDHLLDLPRKDWHAYVREQVRKSELAAQEKQREWLSKRRLGTKPSRPLQAYAGDYDDPAYGTAKVTFEDGQLIWKWSSFVVPLEHYHFDTFALNHELLGFAEVVFKLDDRGAVASMAVAAPLDIEFARR